ncbi:MAG: hypothetical protein CMF50_09785 [Legionellales bacterium]|nr:hypothetical protein [Legionellales bacterium]|tara:strand:- start:11397 stop:12014 length:618 start_codon:yes stop_codon:yes gene_type:complete
MNEQETDVEVIEQMVHTPVHMDLEGPGALLRDARIAQKYNEQDVAAYLRLSTDVIRHLEADRYEKLPALTFVKGYIRSYAKLVGLSGDELVAKLERVNLTEAATTNPVQVEQEASFKDRHVRWVSYGIVGLLVVLVATWWHGHSSNDTATVAQADEAAVAVSNDADETAEVDDNGDAQKDLAAKASDDSDEQVANADSKETTKQS